MEQWKYETGDFMKWTRERGWKGKGKGNLFDGIGDLGTNTIAGEKGGMDRSWNGGEGPLVSEIAASECSSEDLRSHTLPRYVPDSDMQRRKPNCIVYCLFLVLLYIYTRLNNFIYYNIFTFLNEMISSKTKLNIVYKKI